MKIIVETLNQNIEQEELPNKEYSRVEINDKPNNIRIEFDDYAEKQKLIEQLLEEDLKCSDCGDPILIEDRLYCEYCYDNLMDKVKGLEDE